jgi:hypothetical protein
MLNIISDFVKSILPIKRNTTPTGWIKFDAPCCEAQGTTHRRSRRGNLMLNADGAVSYSCFNCAFKASFQPGRQLSFKFRKLLRQMGASENDIKRLVIEAIRIRELVNPDEVKVEEEEEKVEFKVRPLPEGAISFQALLTHYILADFQNIPPLLNSAVDYVKARNIDTDKYEFYWTDATEHSLHQRVIIPMIWEGRTIGYTSRAFVDGVKPKYYSQYEPNFVFNLNNQMPDAKFVIVCEGPFDAMAIDGVAIMSNDCSDTQASIIDKLDREVIVVPDTDKAGAQLVNKAIENGWSVSFPVWQEDAACKDINDAVIKYGKLFVLKSIIDAKESSKLKIELMKKRMYN